MDNKNKSSARRIVFRDVKSTLKTATVEVAKWDAAALLNGARENLGRVVVEYEGRETFQFLINEAKSDVAKWQAVLDSFDK
jgi:hypothetical protein